MNAAEDWEEVRLEELRCFSNRDKHDIRVLVRFYSGDNPKPKLEVMTIHTLIKLLSIQYKLKKQGVEIEVTDIPCEYAIINLEN